LKKPGDPKKSKKRQKRLKSQVEKNYMRLKKNRAARLSSLKKRVVLQKWKGVSVLGARGGVLRYSEWLPSEKSQGGPERTRGAKRYGSDRRIGIGTAGGGRNPLERNPVNGVPRGTGLNRRKVGRDPADVLYILRIYDGGTLEQGQGGSLWGESVIRSRLHNCV